MKKDKKQKQTDLRPFFKLSTYFKILTKFIKKQFFILNLFWCPAFSSPSLLASHHSSLHLLPSSLPFKIQKISNCLVFIFVDNQHIPFFLTPTSFLFTVTCKFCSNLLSSLLIKRKEPKFYELWRIAENCIHKKRQWLTHCPKYSKHNMWIV